MSQPVAAKYIKIVHPKVNITLYWKVDTTLYWNKNGGWFARTWHSVYQKDIKRVVSLFEKYSTLRQGQAILKKKV